MSALCDHTALGVVRLGRVHGYNQRATVKPPNIIAHEKGFKFHAQPQAVHILMNTSMLQFKMLYIVHTTHTLHTLHTPHTPHTTHTPHTPHTPHTTLVHYTHTNHTQTKHITHTTHLIHVEAVRTCPHSRTLWVSRCS